MKSPQRTAAIVNANYNRRQRVTASGGRRIEILMNSNAVRALDRLRARRSETITACIERLLIDAAKKEHLS